MEAAAKKAEPRGAWQLTWVWLPDRRCYVDPVAAAYRKKNPLPESLQPPCDSPPCESPQREGFEGASLVVFRGTFKRSLSQGDIQERMSSCSQEVFCMCK